MKNLKSRKNRSVCLLAAALAGLLLGGCKKPDPVAETTGPVVTQPAGTTVETTEAPRENLLVLYGTEIREDAVVVTTSLVTLKLPFAFGDLIAVEEQSTLDWGKLAFSLRSGDTQWPLYTLFFGEGEGYYLGTLTTEAGEVEVYGALHSISEELAESQTASFYAAQETFNDVVDSLEEWPGFDPVN